METHGQIAQQARRIREHRSRQQRLPIASVSSQPIDGQPTISIKRQSAQQARRIREHQSHIILSIPITIYIFLCEADN